MALSSASVIPVPRIPIGKSSPDHGEIPFCSACDTAEHLAFEDFVPSRVLPDGQEHLGTVSYLCTGCNQYSSHAVPDAWQPPAWHWYV
ncbi:hypothetical protein MN0502_14950 [Arthrobacter sp. MN05-02]|nr:hypothetical protein MN0502_14950 [Arthrobacter sp. MN05-02]